MPELKTVEERRAEGRARRADVSRSSHAGWRPPNDRPDPIALLEARHRHASRDLVPIRVGRMLVSPFTFLRGAAEVMAHDLSSTPTTGSGSRRAATPTCSTSASSRLPNATSSSTSTTSTRRSRHRGNGTSSASPRASRSRAAERVARAGAGRCRGGEHGARLPDADGGALGHGAARRLVRPRRRRRGARAWRSGRTRRCCPMVGTCWNARATTRAWPRCPSSPSSSTGDAGSSRIRRSSSTPTHRASTYRATRSTRTARRLARDRRPLLDRYRVVDAGPEGRRRRAASGPAVTSCC